MYWYLATAYSKYPEGLEEAFQIACRTAGRLIKQGLPVYSPIAHTHPVAIHSDMDPFDHDLWLPADEPHMRAAIGLIVLKMPSWVVSRGVDYEIRFFKKLNKPVLYMEYEDD